MSIITREKGMEVLGMVLKSEKNVSVFERNIRKSTDSPEEYRNVLYQTVYDISEGKNYRDVLEDIKVNKMNWNHVDFYDMKILMEEQDDFIENPFEIVEGAQQCSCGSWKVFSFSKQLRGCDEPSTTFAECMKCGNKWTYSG